MPTLLEKPVSSTPVAVLATRHRWERWRGVLIALAAGLGLTFAMLLLLHPSWHTPSAWGRLAAVWLGGLVLTGLAAALAWKFAPVSMADTAQNLDRTLSSKNRLEAAAAWKDSSTPLAQAQREETAVYLQHEPRVRPSRLFSWLLGLLLVLASVHLFMLLLWTVPLLLRPAAPTPPPAPKELPKASIIWKSPEPESKANPVEEVPLVAVAQSTTGLRNLSLEISVNGEPKKSAPLPAKPFDAAGTNTIKTSIYMDELEVASYDVVTYYIRGQRVTDQKVPDTTSAIQFIQVRPFRDDAFQVPPGMPGSASYALLIRLKLAELKSIKENFILAHTDLPVTDPAFVKENERVGKNQGDLSAKTEEVVQSMISEGLDARIIDLLRQAEVPMDDASKKILATHNADALPSQQKALSLIVEVEKFFIKIMGQPVGGKPVSNPDDPFHDKQQHEMKKRFETAAGQLEQLAQNQAKLAKDLNPQDSPGSSGNPEPKAAGKPSDQPDANPASKNSPTNSGTPSPEMGPDGKPVPLPTPQAVDPFKPDDGKGTLAERQTRVLQGVGTLLNTNSVLPAPVLDALQAAQKHATESLHQLDQGNQDGAREPATAAAQDLQRAVGEMNKAGDEQTKQDMEQAQGKLNDLAQKLNDMAKTAAPHSQQPGLSDVAKQTRDARKELEKDADRQQEGGSASGAQKLNQLANQIGHENIAPDLQKLAAAFDPAQAQLLAQKLQSLARQAAQGTAGEKPSEKDIRALIAAIEKSRANLARMAARDGSPSPKPGDQQGAGQKPGDKEGQGQQPGDQQGAGQKPGDKQGQGQQPGDQPGAGQKPGDKEGQGQQPGDQQGAGQKPGDEQGQGHGQGMKPDPQQGGGQGSGQDQQASTQQGQNPNPDPTSQQGQGGGQGQSTAKDSTQSSSGSTKATPQPNQGLPPSDTVTQKSELTDQVGNGAGGSGRSLDGAEGKAYQEIVDDLRDEMQRATVIVPNPHGVDGRVITIALEDNHYRETHVGNVVALYRVVDLPLQNMVTELKALLAQTQREDLVNQSQLDEAPALYRSAVSDYFETMSKDYHPDAAGQDTAKP